MKSFLAHLTPKRRHRLFVAYLAVMLLVFLTPTPDTGLIESMYLDKVVHFVLFFGFAVLFHMDRTATWWQIFLISTMLAAAVELVQWVLPFRDAEWGDLIAGVFGAGLAIIIMFLIQRSAPTEPPDSV